MNKVKLPENIDYSIYNNTNGMSTKHWGPSAWDFLFTSIMGTYPFKIDENNAEHIIIKNAFKNMFLGLQITMPCIFCRESFKIFLLELPIEPYLIGRIELMYWLYQIKDKVNNKLLTQEMRCYNDEKRKLKFLFYRGDITEEEYYSEVNKFKKDILLTTPTPSFKEILEKYEKLRAVCSNKANKCTLPNIN